MDTKGSCIVNYKCEDVALQQNFGRLLWQGYQRGGCGVRNSYPFIAWFIWFVVLLGAVSWTTVLQAQDDKMKTQQELLQQPDKIATQVRTGKINLQQVPDPHWKKNGCVACHTKTPDKNGLYLRNKNIDLVCNNCHGLISNHTYIHPSGMRPSKKIAKRMSKEFRSAVRKGGGVVKCTTCHDLSKQCKIDNISEKQLNPRFFRAGPYHERTEICYHCHNDDAYKRLNPHDQITKRGKIREERCGVCHRTLDGLKDAKSIDQVDFNMTRDLSKMCTGCHPWKPHPGGSFSFGKKKPPNHLVKPRTDIKEFYDMRQAESDVLLPLEPGTGKVFCGTCHNPHAKGVIKNPAAAWGAGSKQRLRMVELCTQCHDK